MAIFRNLSEARKARQEYKGVGIADAAVPLFRELVHLSAEGRIRTPADFQELFLNSPLRLKLEKVYPSFTERFYEIAPQFALRLMESGRDREAVDLLRPLAMGTGFFQPRHGNWEIVETYLAAQKIMIRDLVSRDSLGEARSRAAEASVIAVAGHNVHYENFGKLDHLANVISQAMGREAAAATPAARRRMCDEIIALMDAQFPRKGQMAAATAQKAVADRSLYDALGVDPSATQAEIQSAYRNLARMYHPDANKASGAEAKFKEISFAYETLGDPERRRQYDMHGLRRR